MLGEAQESTREAWARPTTIQTTDVSTATVTATATASAIATATATATSTATVTVVVVADVAFQLRPHGGDP